MNESKVTPLTALSAQEISVSDVIQLIECFPIGQRVEYFPEYQNQMTMRSLILGYEINGKLIYKQNQLEAVTGQGNHHLILHMQEKEYDISKIDSFCMILPAKAGEEGKLNYPSKAALGSMGQFRNGNSISLTARYENSGVVTVETTVRESILPKEGIYRNHRMAMLEVISTSLEVKEQRTHHRLNTNVPVVVGAKPDISNQAGFLVDYSEITVQIELEEGSRLSKQAKPGMRVLFSLELDALQRKFIVGGEILRKKGSNIIVTMQEILEDEKLRSFELMDALDLKACLLQHPATR